MSTYKLKVEKASINGTTGHHTVFVRVIETTPDNQTIQGVGITHGIDPISLQRKFNGDIQAWLNDVGQDMLTKHIQHTQIQTELLKLTGTTIEIKESS
jgi:hypothetical protein